MEEWIHFPGCSLVMTLCFHFSLDVFVPSPLSPSLVGSCSTGTGLGHSFLLPSLFFCLSLLLSPPIPFLCQRFSLSLHVLFFFHPALACAPPWTCCQEYVKVVRTRTGPNTSLDHKALEEGGVGKYAFTVSRTTLKTEDRKTERKWDSEKER